MSIVLDVVPGAESFIRRAVEWIYTAVAAPRETYAICLSGGGTPRPVYAMLAEPASRGRLPWARIHWFFGDERYVPHAAARSNFRMVDDVLFSHAPIPAHNIHAIPTGPTPADAAQAYAMELQRFYGASAIDPGRPLFDLTLLGLGADGHAASLFPAHPALEEAQKWAVPVETMSQPEPRITLTLPVLESSRMILFLVAGAEKRSALQRLRAGDTAIPAARVHPPGVVHVLADSAAAGQAAG
jgi:6-phosphogluconolactonase